MAQHSKFGMEYQNDSVLSGKAPGYEYGIRLAEFSLLSLLA